MKNDIELTIEQLEERVEFTVATVMGGELGSLQASEVYPIKCGFGMRGSCSSLVSVNSADLNSVSIDTTTLTPAELQMYQTLLR
jgi:hypothetical protein